MRALALSLATLCALLSLPVPAAAQNCGPQTIGVSTTVLSCGGTILVAAPAPATTGWCSIQFTAVGPYSPGSGSSPYYFIGLPALLVLGASNPGIDLTPYGFPSCTLGAAPDVLVDLAATGGGLLTATIPVPADPSLIGAGVFAQGVVSYYVGIPGGGSPNVALNFSNGLLIRIL